MANTNDNVKREITITFEIKAGNPFDLNKKKKILEKFSRLPMDDQERLEQIIEKPSALKALKDNWAMLKAMF